MGSPAPLQAKSPLDQSSGFLFHWQQPSEQKICDFDGNMGIIYEIFGKNGAIHLIHTTAITSSINGVC